VCACACVPSPLQVHLLSRPAPYFAGTSTGPSARAQGVLALSWAGPAWRGWRGRRGPATLTTACPTARRARMMRAAIRTACLARRGLQGGIHQLRHTHTHTHTHANPRINAHPLRDRQTGRQTGRQADGQTIDKHTHIDGECVADCTNVAELCGHLHRQNCSSVHAHTHTHTHTHTYASTHACSHTAFCDCALLVSVIIEGISVIIEEICVCVYDRSPSAVGPASMAMMGPQTP
jgi:hypothetical protein